MKITRRRGANITVPNKDDSGLKNFFNGKKSKLASIFKAKPKQDASMEGSLQFSEEEEALRCLDEIIESENHKGRLRDVCQTIRPLTSPAFFDSNVPKPTDFGPESREQMKYDTIKGFDSFMLY